MPTCEPLYYASGCREYYNNVAIPNMLGTTSQHIVYNYLETLLGYAVGVNCHQHMKEFGCYYLYPKCVSNDDQNIAETVKLPCGQFCEAFTKACDSKFNIGGILPLLSSKCILLPDKDEDPNCIFRNVECDDEPPRNRSITGGTWALNSSMAGSKAQLVCPSGYQITGTKNIQCQNDGKWSTSDGKCILLDDNTNLYVGIGCAVTIIILLIVVIPILYKRRYEINVLLYNKFRFRFQKQNEEDGKQYDAFISYNVKVKKLILNDKKTNDFCLLCHLC